MKVIEFQKAINVTSGSYGRFMKQNGPTAGMGSDTYGSAYKFFKKRELRGIKMSRKKVKTADQDKSHDLSNIQLDGEETGNVEVYDTCDEVRRKMPLI